jgi:hypothetical protein
MIRHAQPVFLVFLQSLVSCYHDACGLTGLRILFRRSRRHTGASAGSTSVVVTRHTSCIVTSCVARRMVS